MRVLSLNFDEEKMTVLQIITDPKKLSRICEPVTEHAESIARDLLDTAEHHKARCIGLAAPQIGYNVRMFVMKYGNQFITVINPRVIKSSRGNSSQNEGCLSRPGVNVLVCRHKRIQVIYKNDVDDVVKCKFNNLDARVFQHELDHLNGILI
jgi:peptide deformylase